MYNHINKIPATCKALGFTTHLLAVLHILILPEILTGSIFKLEGRKTQTRRKTNKTFCPINTNKTL